MEKLKALQDGTFSNLNGMPLTHTDLRSYWTTAQMALDVTVCRINKDKLEQLLMGIQDALNIAKVYALGTSQGGFIVSRMAILRPEKILGIVPIGSSMFAETEDTRKLGCWNALKVFPPVRFPPNHSLLLLSHSTF